MISSAFLSSQFAQSCARVRSVPGAVPPDYWDRGPGPLPAPAPYGHRVQRFGWCLYYSRRPPLLQFPLDSRLSGLWSLQPVIPVIVQVLLPALVRVKRTGPMAPGENRLPGGTMGVVSGVYRGAAAIGGDRRDTRRLPAQVRAIRRGQTGQFLVRRIVCTGRAAAPDTAPPGCIAGPNAASGSY